MRGSVLFVSHDATRTGAPIALLGLVGRCKQLGELQFEVLLRGGGDLVDRFRALAPVTCWPSAEMPPPAVDATTPDAVRQVPPGERGAPERTDARRQLVDTLGGKGLALIYSNTITNGEVLAALSPLGVPVITHVHELDYWMRHRVSRADLELARDHTDLFIAASHAVAHALSTVLSVPSHKVVVVHESIEIRPEPSQRVRQDARTRWGIPEGAFVVGASGTMDWRKGVDLLPPLAREVAQWPSSTPVHWLWVGGDCVGPVAEQLRHAFSRCGLADRLHLTGTLDQPIDAFAAFDAFALVSHEDPFPLVMLEAASMGVPIVCFEGAGGAPEFVGYDAGFVVPYLDLPGMAARVAELRDVPALAREQGAVARRRVVSDHDVATTAPRIVDLIRRVAERRWP